MKNKYYYYQCVDSEENNDMRFEGNSYFFKSSLEYMFTAAMLSCLERRGVFESISKRECLKNGEPQPFLTLPFIDWFESYDFSDWSLVEFGSGNSTIYFSKHFKNIISYENSIDHFNDLNKKGIPKNVDYRYILTDDMENGNFNLPKEHSKVMLIIDSDCNRFSVVKRIIEKKFTGLLIFDNTNYYPNSVKYLLNQGYKEFPLWGFALSQSDETCTSIFIKDLLILPNRKIDFNTINHRNIIKELWAYDSDK